MYMGYVALMLISHIFYPETKAFTISNEMDYRLMNGFLNVEIWMFVSAFAAPIFIIPFGFFKLKEKEL